MPVLDIPGLKIPKVLETFDSEINGKIEVLEVGETLKLRVDNIDQSISADSPNARNLVWGRVIDILKQNEPKLKNMLILGLGGATVQHLINKEFPEAYMVSVDIDPVMEEIAKKYFKLDEIENHRVIIGDACLVLAEPSNYELIPESYQVVFVDIYVGETFPELGNSGNFLAAVKEMLIPGGLVIINRIYTKHHQDDVNNFIDFVEEYLHDVQTVTVAGYTNSDNVLIYGRK